MPQNHQHAFKIPELTHCCFALLLMACSTSVRRNKSLMPVQKPGSKIFLYHQKKHEAVKKHTLKQIHLVRYYLNWYLQALLQLLNVGCAR